MALVRLTQATLVVDLDIVDVRHDLIFLNRITRHALLEYGRKALGDLSNVFGLFLIHIRT